MFRISTTCEVSFSCRTGSILRVLRIILLINNELAQNIGEGFYANLEALVEPGGVLGMKKKIPTRMNGLG